MQSSIGQSRNNRGALAIFVFCAFVFGYAASAQKQKIKDVHASSDHPEWRLDLQSLGYPANDPNLQRSRNFANFDTVSFLGDNIIAATFVTREVISDLQRREDPNHVRPYSLHAIFLDALAGKVVHTLDWPIDNPNAGTFPRSEGGFLFFATDRIISYSADWTKTKELPLAELEPAGASLGGISESPSAKSVVVQYLNGNLAHCLDVRTDSLEFAPIVCSALEVFTASDAGILTPEQLPGGSFRQSEPGPSFVQYGVAMPDAPHPAGGAILTPEQASTEHTSCNPCVGMAQFIKNDLIAIYAPTYVGLMDLKGKVAFTQHFFLEYKWVDEFGRPLRSSSDGQRFAIALNLTPHRNSSRPIDAALGLHMSTGDLPAEFPLDIEVYDFATAQWVYTLQVNADHIEKVWGIALSRSGDKLAIDSGGAIQMFALPPATN